MTDTEVKINGKLAGAPFREVLQVQLRYYQAAEIWL
jgi:hypothetical protein